MVTHNIIYVVKFVAKHQLYDTPDFIYFSTRDLAEKEAEKYKDSAYVWAKVVEEKLNG